MSNAMNMEDAYREVLRMKFKDPKIRLNFIRKVYGLLFVQLVVTCAIISIFIFVDEVRDWAQKKWVYLLIFTICAFAVLIAMVCGPASLRRKSPWNFILLGLFTIFEGLCLGFAVAYVEEISFVFWSLGITALVTLVVTVASFCTKVDLTGMGGICCMILTALMLFGIIVLLLLLFDEGNAAYRKPLVLVYSGIGILVFCGLLAYDTQLLIGGNKKYAIDPEEYVFAVVSIYLDIINIFLLILQIFTITDN